MSEIEVPAEETEEAAPSGKNEEKTFSQKDIDSAVKARLARAKKEHDAEMSALVTERDSLQKTLDAIDAEYASDVDELSKGVDEDILALLDGLSNREKVTKLKKIQSKFGKSSIPVTPQSASSEKDEPKYKRRTNF